MFETLQLESFIENAIDSGRDDLKYLYGDVSIEGIVEDDGTKLIKVSITTHCFYTEEDFDSMNFED